MSDGAVGPPTVADTIAHAISGLHALHVRRHVFYTYVTLMVGHPDQRFKKRARRHERASRKT